MDYLETQIKKNRSFGYRILALLVDDLIQEDGKVRLRIIFLSKKEATQKFYLEHLRISIL